MVAPELARVAANNAGRYLVVKVNTDAVPELGDRFGIRSIPTMAVFAEGRESGTDVRCTAGCGHRVVHRSVGRAVEFSSWPGLLRFIPQRDLAPPPRSLCRRTLSLCSCAAFALLRRVQGVGQNGRSRPRCLVRRSASGPPRAPRESDPVRARRRRRPASMRRAISAGHRRTCSTPVTGFSAAPRSARHSPPTNAARFCAAWC